MAEKHIHCPVNATDCPYWKKNGCCSMEEEGLDPIEECDDFMLFWFEDEDYHCDCERV